MAPRRRHPRNVPLPRNLRVRDGYYSYTNPLNGMERGLGRNKSEAVQFALDANEELSRLRGKVSAAEWIRGDNETKTWGAWLNVYEVILAERELSYQTRSTYSSLLKRARMQWPVSTAIAAIDTKMVSDAILSVVAEGKRRMAQVYRSFFKDCFKRAAARGWRTDNPASITDAVKAKPQRSRLTIESFRAVYDHPETPVWLRNAMALALVSGQRREDVARAQRRSVHDGCWWVEQKKTGSRVVIPLGIRLAELGLTLGEVLEQCRATGVLSPHVIHQPLREGTYKAGRHVYAELLTRKFSEVIALLQRDWGGRSPPTFHEIRSLSKRLYDDQGGVNTKQLLGHKSDTAAATYSDARGEWVKVSVA